MAAKVIHFKKNGSLAPQKFVADDGGNNISAGLSSPRGAETIFLPFYRHRAAREQYFYRFIVAVQRGNNILAVLSSPCGAGTIFPPFQCLQCSCKYIPERFWLLQANCERSEMWREPRGDGGGPRAGGKMKSSHSKWNDCFLF